MKGLRDIANFGKVEAEDDAVLDYFVEMNVTENVDCNDAFLVLGRKGAGKTALFRYFTEKLQSNNSSALNLNGYPWKVHEKIKDSGVEHVESYVASWKYLIVIEFAKLVVKLSDRHRMTEIVELNKFLKDNYGTNDPKIESIFSLSKLKVSGDLEPQVLGCKLGKISLSRNDGDVKLGAELNALTDKILRHVIRAAEVAKIEKVFVHFDELDRGITTLSESRKDMIIGLVLASKEITKVLKNSTTTFKSVVYLRRDIWDELKFSDKNKISSSNSEFIEWGQEQLFGLIEKRIQVLLGHDCTWDDIDDGKRINKQPKWKHIIERTLLRPRDVISFLNILLEATKKRNDEHLVLKIEM